MPLTAADASPISDLCLACWEHRHEDCTGDAWCLDGAGEVSCRCLNDWHSVDLDDPADRSWWAENFPKGVNCHHTDGREHWNRGALRGDRPALQYIAVCSACPKVHGFGTDLTAREVWTAQHVRDTGHFVSWQS